MKRKLQPRLVQLPIVTREGKFVANYSVNGLAGLDFPKTRRRVSFASRASLPMTIRRWHRATEVAVKRALTGRAPRVLPPLDLSLGTEFQRQVWSALLKIPCGETRTYREIASATSSHRAARAVGAACGANPIPVLVPCHRVVAARHKLGGFSSGINWKRLLLWREESRDWWDGKEEPFE